MAGKLESPKGDIGAKRYAEESGFFKKKIKAAGQGNVSALPYRRPKIEGGSGARAV